jgi:pyruvate/2-oxoglutarate dehydrogenase complex dihydrolipoamide dehydrogenase (E3) component
VTASLLEHDRWDDALRAQVHPEGWTNPTPATRYDLVVIGAGTGGLVTAAGAAGLGARVALVERHLMGGDCLNVGCVPSKAIISAARAWAAAAHAHEAYGAPRLAPGDAGDFARVMARMREIRSAMSPVDGAARFAGLGVDVFLGDGRFTARDTVEVNGARLRFKRAVIATGARAAAPDIPGLRDGTYHTNETIFTLTARPAHLLVVGGGPIGCELAQAFAMLGTPVTLVHNGPRVLPRDDADASALVQTALLASGVTIRPVTELVRVSYVDGQAVLTCRSADGALQTVSGDTLLVAAGRAPNVDGLGLDAAGVQVSARGVAVSDRLQTSNSRIFAVGDVCSPLQFTHSADFQARLVLQNALFFGRARASALVTPWATYTAPEVAQVGHTTESARAAGVRVETFTVPLHDVDRARLAGETDGFVRMHVAAGSDRIVGATIVAAHAGDLIAEVTLAMTNQLGLSAIGRTMHPYPTTSEALRKVADAWRRTKLTPRVQRLLSRYFRWFR